METVSASPGSAARMASSDPAPAWAGCADVAGTAAWGVVAVVPPGDVAPVDAGGLDVVGAVGVAGLVPPGDTPGVAAGGLTGTAPGVWDGVVVGVVAGAAVPVDGAMTAPPVVSGAVCAHTIPAPPTDNVSATTNPTKDEPGQTAPVATP